ncbi:hypothetical protein BB560_001839 [Smittium megazygosporum]|uniref:Uncharacterized protein n=1 Tax=Smittium megazygosporum TaxID=133381 RepID=A0A2T9ZGI3_9FUNG|nr:hypothetical protein BB560_001839 [Smittium megazygosporum]
MREASPHLKLSCPSFRIPKQKPLTRVTLETKSKTLKASSTPATSAAEYDADEKLGNADFSSKITDSLNLDTNNIGSKVQDVVGDIDKSKIGEKVQDIVDNVKNNLGNLNDKISGIKDIQGVIKDLVLIRPRISKATKAKEVNGMVEVVAMATMEVPEVATLAQFHTDQGSTGVNASDTSTSTKMTSEDSRIPTLSLVEDGKLKLSPEIIGSSMPTMSNGLLSNLKIQYLLQHWQIL